MLNARRSGIFARLALAALAVLICAGRTCAQTPDDVDPNHWAYAAVNDLAAKGLIKGYPPSGYFFGKLLFQLHHDVAGIVFVLALAGFFGIGYLIHRYEQRLIEAAELALPGPLEDVIARKG